jgi:hypothetical protein
MLSYYVNLGSVYSYFQGMLSYYVNLGSVYAYFEACYVIIVNVCERAHRQQRHTRHITEIPTIIDPNAAKPH